MSHPLAWLAWRIAVRHLPLLARRLAPWGSVALGWLLAAALYAAGCLLVLLGIVPGVTGLLEAVLGSPDPDKRAKEITIKLTARLRKHSGNPRYKALAERLEDLKERHEHGLLVSIDFLKELLELAKDVVQFERETPVEDEIDRGKAALTELFEEVKNGRTPVMIKRIVDDIVVNMVDVGEETGELDTMLFKVADTFDEDVKTLTDGLMALMEPLLIVFLGGAVGFIVIALFMPLVKLIQGLS